MHLVQTAQTLLSFSHWNTIIDGDPLGTYYGNGSYFKACHFNDPTDCIRMSIRDQVVHVDPLGSLSSVLVFSEGNLIYPLPSEQLSGGTIRLSEEMEIKVMLFANPPMALNVLLGRLDQPATIEEFDNLAALFSPTECSMLASSITTESYPIEIWRGLRGHRKSRRRLAMEYFITPIFTGRVLTSPASLLTLFVVWAIVFGIIYWISFSVDSQPWARPSVPTRRWVVAFPTSRSDFNGCVSIPYLGDFPGFNVIFAKLEECIGFNCRNHCVAGTSSAPCGPECIDGQLADPME